MELGNIRSRTSSPTQPLHQGGRIDNSWPMPVKFVGGVGLITIVAFSAMMGLQMYTQYQNGKINFIDCQKDFNFYKNAAEKDGNASDQYCVAQKYAEGVETQQSLSQARIWYKKAYEQGLTLAARNLCKSAMYEYQYGTEEEYFAANKIFHEYVDQFADICCPRPCTFTPNTCIAPRCPWEKEYSTFMRV